MPLTLHGGCGEPMTDTRFGLSAYVPTASVFRSTLYANNGRASLRITLASVLVLYSMGGQVNAQSSTQLRFDGVKEYVQVADQDALSISTTGTLTVSAWINPAILTFPQTEGTGYVHFLGKGEGAGTTGQQEWVFRMYSQGNTE